ncbi:hypothetical protein LIA77_09217 [Sarocladium implicatum]|nr:hypothetical protein LIA77_09217 [Sarocladium implicatum]
MVLKHQSSCKTASRQLTVMGGLVASLAGLARQVGCGRESMIELVNTTDLPFVCGDAAATSRYNCDEYRWCGRNAVFWATFVVSSSPCFGFGKVINDSKGPYLGERRCLKVSGKERRCWTRPTDDDTKSGEVDRWLWSDGSTCGIGGRYSLPCNQALGSGSETPSPHLRSSNHTQKFCGRETRITQHRCAESTGHLVARDSSRSSNRALYQQHGMLHTLSRILVDSVIQCPRSLTCDYRRLHGYSPVRIDWAAEYASSGTPLGAENASMIDLDDASSSNLPCSLAPGHNATCIGTTQTAQEIYN